MNCPHCNHPASGRYCSNCGEKLVVRKLAFHPVLSGFVKDVSNFDKGILFVLKSMFLDPKSFCLSYLAGKRKPGLNPFTFFFISISVYVALNQFLDLNPVFESKGYAFKTESYNKGVKLGAFFGAYKKYFWLFMFIPLASSARFVFKKYNFTEHIAISAYIMGFATSLLCVIQALFYIPILWNPFAFLIILWSVFRIFRNGESLLKMFISATSVLLLMLLKLLFCFLLVYYAFIK